MAMIRFFTALVVILGTLSACVFWLDEWLYAFLHQHYNYATRPVPDSLKFATRFLRSAEDWGENVFISMVAFAMWRLDPLHRGRIVCLIAAALATTLSAEAFKRCCGRSRPEVSMGRTQFAGFQHSMNAKGDDHSFPSGHTAAAAAYSGAISAFYPPLRPICFFLAAGTGASRIWKERHFLSDCLAGLTLGWCIAHAMATNKRLAPWHRALNRFLAPSGDLLLRRQDARGRRRGRSRQQLSPSLGLLRQSP